MRPKPSSPGTGLWRAFLDKCNRFEDRRTRISIAMAVVAALSAITAYRVSDEERKSAMCDHRLGQVKTYELAQRERYRNAWTEHERWLDQYGRLKSSSERLLRRADAIRASSRAGLQDSEAGALDVEAQIEHSVTRAIRPVRDYTDPELPPGRDLESREAMRAEQDVSELGIPKRCAVRDNFWPVVAEASADTADAPSENYSEQLGRDVASLHRTALDDKFALVGFIVVLLLFMVSEAYGKTTRLVLQIVATLAIPASVVFAVTRNDEWMMVLLPAANLLMGSFLVAWVILKLRRVGRSEAAGTSKPPRSGEMAERTIGSILRSVLMLVSAQAILSVLKWLRSDLPDGQGAANATGAPFQRVNLSGSGLRHLIRRMEAAIGVVLFFSAAVAGLATYDFVTHAPRTATIFVAELLPNVAYFFAVWWAVNTMRRVRAAQSWSPHRMDVAKGAFAYVDIALAAVGLFIVVGSVAAIIVDAGNYAWLRAMGYASAALAAVLAALLIGVERWVRKRARELDAAGEQDVATAKTEFTARGTAKPPLQHGDDEWPVPEAPPELDDSATAARLPYVPTGLNRFGTIVVTLIAITVIASASVSYLYMSEEGQANGFAAKAAREQLELMQSSSGRAAGAYRTIEQLVKLREAHLRTVADEQLRGDPAAEARESVAVGDNRVRGLHVRKERVGDGTAFDPKDDQPSAAVRLTFGGENGPDNDPSFPAKLFISSTIPAVAERLALWDAYDDAYTASEIRAGLLSAGATCLLIALYFFIHSPGVGRADTQRPNDSGHILTGMAAAMLLGGLGLAFVGRQQAVPAVDRTVTLPEACRTRDEAPELPIPNAAAVCYARAELLAALARRPDDYKAAQKAYAAATQDDMRPGFTLARYRSIRATQQFTAAQHAERMPIVHGKELKQIVDRERRVIRELEDRKRAIPVLLRETFGFHEYLRAIDTGDSALLHAAVADLSAAALTEPQARFRLAVALLAANRTEESSAYRLALGSPAQSEEVRIGAVNDLELFRKICPPGWHEKASSSKRRPAACQRRLQVIINNREAAIMRKLWPTKRLVAIPVSRARLDASAMPGGIAWRLRIMPPAPPDLPLVMVVSKNDETAHRNWDVIASASGPVRPSEVTRDKGAELIGFRNVVPRSETCLQSGALYRVELRLGQRVLAATNARAPGMWLPPFGSIILHEQGVAMCAPIGNDGWSRAKAHPNHLEASYRARDFSTGADLFAFFSPRHAPLEARLAFRRRAIDDSLERGPGRSLAVRRPQGMDEPCLHAPGIGKSTRVAYAFEGLEVLSQTWSSQDGLFHVAVVWRDAVSGSAGRAVACRVLASITPSDLEAGTAASGGRSFASAHIPN